ncbi:hypothetical protein AhyVDH1_041 [Aeromonas phage AhyVDH1]|nr:hypothetical protein AhyVDH1_041 [Aeromonas phage AhyVDH1]
MTELIQITLGCIVALMFIAMLMLSVKVAVLQRNFDDINQRFGKMWERLNAQTKLMARHADSLQKLRRRSDHHATLIDAQHRRMEDGQRGPDWGGAVLATQSNPIPEIVGSSPDRRTAPE